MMRIDRWTALSLVLLLMPLSLAADAGTQTPTPDGTSEERILYQSNVTGVHQIYLMKTDGSNQAQLTSLGANYSPVMAPDGRSIAFYSERSGAIRAYVMGSDGSNQIDVTGRDLSNPGGLAWSLDSADLFFAGDTATKSGIYKVSRTGGSVETMVESAYGVPLYAISETSKDGNFLLGGMGTAGNEASWEIIKIDTATKAIVQLTNDGQNQNNPHYSPDGSEIVYTDKPGCHYVAVMTSSGAFERYLTGCGSDVRPAWSPAGDKIAWDNNAAGNDEVRIANTDGSGQIDASNDGGRDVNAKFNLDGSKLCFISDRSGTWGIYKADLDGSNLQLIADHLGTIVEYRWVSIHRLFTPTPTSTITDTASSTFTVTPSPTITQTPWPGNAVEKVLYHSDVSGTYQIYSMNPDGSGTQRLTTATANCYFPSVSPDGTLIAYACEQLGSIGMWLMNADGTNSRHLNSASPNYVWSTDSGRIYYSELISGYSSIRSVKPDNTDLRVHCTSSDSNEVLSVQSLSADAQSLICGRITGGAAATKDILRIRLSDGLVSDIVANDGIENYCLPSACLGLSDPILFNQWTGVTDLWRIDLDGTNKALLSSNACGQHWLPDGRILYMSYSDPREIYVMSKNGSGITNLTNNAANDWNPAPSLDGSKAYFVSNRSGVFAIWSMDMTGGNLTQLTGDVHLHTGLYPSTLIFPSATPTPSLSATITLSATPTPSPSATSTMTLIGTPSITTSNTPTITATSTITASTTCSLTPSVTLFDTPSSTTPSSTPTQSSTEVPTVVLIADLGDEVIIYPNPLSCPGGNIAVRLEKPGVAKAMVLTQRGNVAKECTMRSNAPGIARTGIDCVGLGKGIHIMLVEITLDDGTKKRLKPVRFSVVE